MNIEVVQITKEQGDAILSQKEGHFLDFKAIEIKPSKLTETISAFANASGGELFVGVDQLDVLGTVMFSWRGFTKPEDANSHIQVFEELFPLGQYYSYTFLRHPVLPGFVLQVEVRKSRQIAFASDRIPYLRRSAQNLGQNTPEKLGRLRLDKGIASFESETTDAPIEAVSNAAPLLTFLMTVVPTAEPEQFARNGAIVRMVNKFPDPPNKDVGEGLNTAFNAMSALRLKPPQIEERDNSLVIHIKHEPLASPEETVMECLESHPEIVNRIGRQITGIQSENSMKNVFNKLRERKMIEPIPGREGFASAWRKKTPH